MGTNLVGVFLQVGTALMLAHLTGCAAVKEKTAPCKRPTELTAYADDPRRPCVVMHAVNDPSSAFAAARIIEERSWKTF